MKILEPMRTISQPNVKTNQTHREIHQQAALINLPAKNLKDPPFFSELHSILKFRMTQKSLSF
jgi:hypothetical protein